MGALCAKSNCSLAKWHIGIFNLPIQCDVSHLCHRSLWFCLDHLSLKPRPVNNARKIWKCQGREVYLYAMHAIFSSNLNSNPNWLLSMWTGCNNCVHIEYYILCQPLLSLWMESLCLSTNEIASVDIAAYVCALFGTITAVFEYRSFPE